MRTPKKHLLVFAVALVTLGTATGALAGPGAFIGLNFPTGEFNSGSDVGYTLGGYYTAPVIPLLLDVGGTVAYSDFSLSSDEDLGAVLGDSFNVWEIEALGEVKVLMLKGFLGIGLANHSGVDDGGNSKRDTNWAWQIGASGMIAIIEARLAYHKINVDDGSVNWVSLSAGLSF